MKIEVTVCDVGQEVGEPTTRYVIAREGKEAQLDLCAAHAAPIEELLSSVPAPTQAKAAPVKKAPAKKTPAKKAPTPRRRTAKVVSLDEIEAMKSDK